MRTIWNKICNFSVHSSFILMLDFFIFLGTFETKLAKMLLLALPFHLSTYNNLTAERIFMNFDNGEFY
jgi:hypothetical protein